MILPTQPQPRFARTGQVREQPPIIVPPFVFERRGRRWGYIVRALWQWDEQAREWVLEAGGDVEAVPHVENWLAPNFPMFPLVTSPAPPYREAVAHYFGTDREWHQADRQANYF